MRTLRLLCLALLAAFVLAGCTWPVPTPPVHTTTTAPATTTHVATPTTVPPTTTRPTTSTAAPTSTTTVATTTSAPPAGFPSASTTGASGTLAAASGEQILDDNQTYQNHRVTGSITVTACNVTIRNVEVDTGVALSSPVDNTPDVFAIWLKAPEGCTTVLDHVSVIVADAGKPYATEAVRNAYGSGMTITAAKIVGTQLGMTVGPGTVSDSYIDLGATMRGDHNEDILDDGITGLTLRHNTFLNPNDQTAALSLFTEFGPNTNVDVEDNWLAGGGYTCYCGDGASDNNGNPARSVNVDFVDNVFSRQFYPNVGAFGPGRAYNPAGGGTWSGNVFAAPDGTITTTTVPQPSLDGQ